jgi:hypothetical protein
MRALVLWCCHGRRGAAMKLVQRLACSATDDASFKAACC